MIDVQVARSMGIREKVNQSPGIAIGVACAVIVLAVVFVVMQTRGGAPTDIVPVSKVFFTTDDGKTWFADDVKNLPPFTKDGKEAVRAHVYRTSDGTEFVGYLERYSRAGRKALEAALAKPVEEHLEDAHAAAEVQWKKPGGTAWVSANDPRAQKVVEVVSPKGAGDAVSPVSAAE